MFNTSGWAGLYANQTRPAVTVHLINIRDLFTTWMCKSFIGKKHKFTNDKVLDLNAFLYFDHLN